MPETLFDELKRYVDFSPQDEAALRTLHPLAKPHFMDVASVFYQRILEHDGARQALEGGESVVGRLKVTLVAWMDELLAGPWDEAYYERRCRIGRVHVRIALPQHYMFGAMNVVRRELQSLLDSAQLESPTRQEMRRALGKILDLELAIMLHTYREDLLSQQARTERLATFGQLVGSIGHELRNPLGVIETSLYILKGRMGTDERALKHADRIAEQVTVANQIVTDLLDMIRDRPLMRDQVDLQALISEAAGAVSKPQGVAVQISGTQTVKTVEGDFGQLRQVMVNLVENAVHAASPVGEVRIEVSAQPGMVQLAVEDTGPGVDSATRRRLFEPLITTKEKGIGLGLALVKRIVERHGGKIHYEASASGGARFVLHLPVKG